MEAAIGFFLPKMEPTKAPTTIDGNAYPIYLPASSPIPCAHAICAKERYRAKIDSSRPKRLLNDTNDIKVSP
jgi:hypothetical protein